MAIMIACSALMGWIVGAALLVRLVHVRAWRIEAAELTPDEQSLRLRPLMLAGVGVSGGYALLGLAAFGTVSVTVDGPAGTHWVAVVIALIGVLVCTVPMIAVVRVIRRAYARVRGATIRPHGRRYVQVLALITALVLGTGIVIGNAVFPGNSAPHVLGMLLVYLLVLVAVQVLVAPLVIVSLGATALPDETRRRLRRLAGRMDVRVRDIRVIPGRARRLANAAQIGAVPGLRYVVVSDYLLDRLGPDEVDAVVAHELGHIRGHHLTLKLCAVFGAWGLLEAVFVVINALTDVSSSLVLLVPVFLASPLGMLAVHATCGTHLEKRADDTAARTVGGERLASALESISRLNRPAPPGPLWSALNAHPGLDERLARLRKRVPAQTRITATH